MRELQTFFNVDDYNNPYLNTDDDDPDMFLTTAELANKYGIDVFEDTRQCSHSDEEEV